MQQLQGKIRNMTIRYDYQIFCEQPYGGISRYYYELIYRLQQKPGIHIQLDILSADNIFLEQLKGKIKNGISNIVGLVYRFLGNFPKNQEMDNLFGFYVSC